MSASDVVEKGCIGYYADRRKMTFCFGENRQFQVGVDSGPDSEESIHCSAEIKAAQETVKAQVTPEVWEQIDNIFSLISRRSDIDRAEAYAVGFRSAATMLAAGLSKPYRKEAA